MEDLEHILNILTYDDLDEEEKINSVVEYIQNKLKSKNE